MAQDIRKMLREDKTLPTYRPEKGHQKRFEARLEKTFPGEQKKNKSWKSYMFLKIAAVLLVAVGVGFLYYNSGDSFTGKEVVETPPQEKPVETTEAPVAGEYQLSDVSPDFKKIENYYLASLNIELAKLEVNDNNRVLVDSFMTQLAELDAEYKRLNKEISENGLNENSVQAMISNLQLRLELLFKLKTKIKDINQSKSKNYENHQA